MSVVPPFNEAMVQRMIECQFARRRAEIECERARIMAESNGAGLSSLAALNALERSLMDEDIYALERSFLYEGLTCVPRKCSFGTT